VPSWHDISAFSGHILLSSRSTAVAATLFATVAADNRFLLVAQLQLVDLDNRTRGKSATNMAIVSQSSPGFHSSRL
jgi:hypothetical protein